MNIVSFFYRRYRSLVGKIYNILSNKLAYALIKENLKDTNNGFQSKGIPKIYKHKYSKFEIGKNFEINNTVVSNPIGRNHQCLFRIGEDALLSIGNNVGMSGTTIVCQKEIIICDNVKIGGNTCIYDTDFHSLDANDRTQREHDIANTKKEKVFIGENVFIGAHVTILKGVLIGRNSIVGACSVVTKNIPENEIWAGNPAKFIRKIG